MEEKKTTLKVHTVNIYSREVANITGVQEILSSTEREVIAKLGEMFMVITGTNLTVTKLIPDDELLSVKGQIDGIKYEGRITKKSFISRVFK